MASSSLPISEEEIKKILLAQKVITETDWEDAKKNASRRRRAIEEVLIERVFFNEQLDASLIFHLTQWFPYDGTVWENKEGYAHDYFFGNHWRAQVTASAAGSYGYNLASDDDSWVTLNGIVVVNNSGTHASFTKTGNIFLSAGINLVGVYFAERHTVDSGFRFSFDNQSLIITPYPEACDQAAECKANIETNASSTKSSRKIRYTCDNDMSNCAWSELVP